MKRIAKPGIDQVARCHARTARMLEKRFGPVARGILEAAIAKAERTLQKSIQQP